jgi:hypothetical protein
MFTTEVGEDTEETQRLKCFALCHLCALCVSVVKSYFPSAQLKLNHYLEIPNVVPKACALPSSHHFAAQLEITFSDKTMNILDQPYRCPSRSSVCRHLKESRDFFPSSNPCLL